MQNSVEKSLATWRKKMSEQAQMPSNDTPESNLIIDDQPINIDYELVVKIINDLNECKLKPTHINILKQFDIKGVSESIACELIQHALQKCLIAEYTYYNKPAYRLVQYEQPETTLDSTLENVLENDQTDKLSAGKNLMISSIR